MAIKAAGSYTMAVNEYKCNCVNENILTGLAVTFYGIVSDLTILLSSSAVRVRAGCINMPLQKSKKIDFTEFYTDYYQIVYGTIYSRVSNITDTDDLTQDVFIIFYSNMDNIINRRAWIFGTITNVLSNYYRKKKKFTSEEDIENYLADISLSFVNGFRDTRIMIDEAVAHLSESDRLLFDYIAVQNLTYLMAAKHLGVSRRQAEYRYSLIVKDIRKYLGDRGIARIEDLL